LADAQTLSMIADACLGLQSDESFSSDLGAYLARHGLDADDIAAIVAAPRRLGIYRRLVRNNLVDVTHKMLPRTRARVNAFAAGAFDASFDAFLASVGPRTHYLRDVPHEFFAWVAPHWRARTDVPAYALDLACHELTEFAISAVPNSRSPVELIEVALDRSLVFLEATRIVHYDYAVHELPAAEDDFTQPAARATFLLVYRDAEHAIRSLEMTPFAATLTSSLLAGAPLEAAVAHACSARNATRSDTLLRDVARLLENFGERGVLLWARKNS
jgi:uncharacterized protein